MGMVRLIVQLPADMKADLDAIRKEEAVTASGYLRKLLARDLQARFECGWTAKKGWPRRFPWERAAARR